MSKPEEQSSMPAERKKKLEDSNAFFRSPRSLTERVQVTVIVLIGLVVADELVELGFRRGVAGHSVFRVVCEKLRVRSAR